MNYLISEQGEVLGQTLSPENAERIAMVARTPMFVVTSAKDFKKLPRHCVHALNSDYGARSFAALWAMLTKRQFPQWGKVSVMTVVRDLYENIGAEYTQEMLLELIPGGTWISITTAFSMLKNGDYNDGKLMVINKVKDKYRRVK